jgi:hypothetical protein
MDKSRIFFGVASLMLIKWDCIFKILFYFCFPHIIKTKKQPI